ncbi:Aspartyl/glutamyl-tRNA(Asn/Gln) amidotransferase subunit B [Phycisphaerae bacterium RAS1]|nr:Aspartyl/glutamyl-tRNA(Asn/Gln) amidotransferase subunit B [Phycisphaerae bacterium RAS1]
MNGSTRITIEGLAVEPIIGLEIHVQLATRTKMFCGCPLEFGATPNSRVCPVCLGLPGALPVVNRRAVECAVLAGLALNCRIAERTRWDRKSYYYPDLPKNYQISQYDLPLCGAGHFEFPYDGRIGKIRIRRAHLEEDAGKNVHDFPGFSGVDLNRAGTPLLEIVTEPDIHSADEAREFAIQLQRLVTYLGVSEANMQKGQMRFEPNINLRIEQAGGTYLTPIVEVKNLNSFRSLHGAIEFEIRRQFDEWRRTGVVAAGGNKSNRGWDDERLMTLPQREKEEAHDYRYFPDPDLVPLSIDPAWVTHLREEMPELPTCRTERFIAEYKLPAKDAPSLVDDRATADLLDDAAAAGGDRETLGKHFMSFWAMQANQRGAPISRLGVSAAHIAELAMLAAGGQINATAAAQIAAEMARQAAECGRSDRTRGPEAGAPRNVRAVDSQAQSPGPRELAQQLGLLQSRDESEIGAWVEQALSANAKAVQDARENPKKMQAARGFLTGQVMKLSGGKADPKLVGVLIEKKLTSQSSAGA